MIYLDNNATTPLREEVFNAMMPWLVNEYGNPSSHYAMGRRASEAVRRAREIVASMINADPEEIFFTSGGSESNTWALDGLYNIDNGGYILMSNIEHHSLLNARHKKKLIGVDKNGVIDIDTLYANIEYDTPIIAIMMVNNEIGTIEPIEQIDYIAYQNKVFLHCDAVQAFGHIHINVRDYLAMSTMSASAHKIGGPKGVGFLYIQKDVQKLYHPLIIGGQQERGMRGGTENVAGIVGFAKACEIAQSEMRSVYTRQLQFSYDLWHRLKTNLKENINLNGAPIDSYDRMPNNLNICLKGIEAEAMIELLGQQDICVSSGSACNSDSGEPSHVLTSIGLSDDEANSSIRISLGVNTTQEDIEYVAKTIIDDYDMLRR